MDFCLIPFSQQQCEVPINSSLITCYVDPLITSRENTCSRYQKYFLLILSNFALFYSPYMEILVDLMKEDRVIYKYQIDVSESNVEVNLRHFVDFTQLNEMHLSLGTSSRATRINVIIHSPLKNYLPADQIGENTFQLTFNRYLKINETIENESLCYTFLLTSSNRQRNIVEKYVPCLSEKCLTDQNQTRICLQSTPCSHSGSSSLLCRIDRLRSNDQFNGNTSLLYTDLIITTTNTQRTTLHRFSPDLLKSCIAERLIVIIIHGRLEIPSFNSTSFHCSHDLDMKVEFWHGNCSTFEILHTDDLERMYETDLITLGNFYTGQIDRIKITCAVYQATDWLDIPVSFWLIIGIISIITLGISLSMLWYYKKSFRQYFHRLWRSLTKNQENKTDGNSTINSDVNSSLGSGLSGTLYYIKG